MRASVRNGFWAWVRNARDTWDGSHYDDMGGLAAELAFRFFLSLFPAVILIASVGAVVAEVAGVDDPTGRIIEALGDTLPADVTSVLTGQLRSIVDSPNVLVLVLAAAGALWTASGGLFAAMKAMNRAYAVEETRTWLQRATLAVGTTASAGLALILAFILLMGGEVFGDEVSRSLGIEGAFALALRLARWPVVIVLVTGGVAFLYWACPAVKLSFSRVTPGAIAFAPVWFGLTYLFSVYVQRFASFNATYGVLGGAVAIMIWMYLSCYALLLGAELNATLERAVEPDKFARRRRIGNETPTEAAGEHNPSPW